MQCSLGKYKGTDSPYALCGKWNIGEKANKGKLECSAPAHTWNLNRWSWSHNSFIGKDARETGLEVHGYIPS